MHIVQVYVHVKQEYIHEFIKETEKNSRNSIKEPGILRFDLMQQLKDPSRFILIEVYRDKEAPLKHKKSKHYKEWREKVAEMMAETRYSVKFINIFPSDKDW